MYARVINNESWLNPTIHRVESMGGRRLNLEPPIIGNLFYVGKCYTSPEGNIIATVDNGSYEYHLLASDVTYERGYFDNNTVYDNRETASKLLKVAKVGERCTVVDDTNEVIFTGTVRKRSADLYEVYNEKIGATRRFPVEDVLSEQSFDPELRKVDCTIKELMELLKADKPAEHILMDIEDYITN